MSVRPVAGTAAARQPAMALAHRADRAGADQLHNAAVVVARVDLRAHLRGDLRLGRHPRRHAGFVHGVREGFSQ